MTMELNYANNTFVFKLDRNLTDFVDRNLQNTMLIAVQEFVSSDTIKSKIYTEIEKYLASADAKEVLTRMIAEVVSETIKTTILQLKEQNIL